MRRSREIFLAIVLAVGPAATLAASGNGRALGAGSSAPPTTEPVATTEPATTTHTPISADESCLPRETVADRTAVLGGTTEDERAVGRGVRNRRARHPDGVRVDRHRGRAGGGRPARWAVQGGGRSERGGRRPAHCRVQGRTAVACRPRHRDGGRRTRRCVVRGAAPVRAELATAGPEGGWLWYAVAIPRTGAWAPEVVATAYDADGRAIATGADAYHASPGGD